MQFSIVTDDGRRNLMVVDPSLPAPLATSDDHPNFDRIVAAVCKDEPVDRIAALFDASVVAAERFERLSERVSVRNGRIYLDGDEIDNSLTRQVVRFVDADIPNWRPLVAFFEKVQSNPVAHSREQLYDFLNANDFTIAADGDVIGYKGVTRHEDDPEGVYRSTTPGPNVIRNGEPLPNDYVPQAIGDVIEMPRSTVAHDPSQACSYGLHIATFDYAQNYASAGVVLKVKVNPRDVVSVPSDASGAKVRVCRYVVDDIVTERLDAPLDPKDGLPIGTRVRTDIGEGTIEEDDGPDAEPRYKVRYDDADPFGYEWEFGADVEAL